MAESPATQSPNACDAAGRKCGAWAEPDPHGGVMVGTYTAGLREGAWEHRAADGRLRSRGTYAGGMLHGQWEWFRANGKLSQRGSFAHGRKVGTWTRWSAGGQMLDEGDYDDDRKCGLWQTFAADGSVAKQVVHRQRGG